jgi:hypothetical protein
MMPQIFYRLTEADLMLRCKKSELAAWRLRKPRRLSRPGSAASLPQQRPDALAHDAR